MKPFTIPETPAASGVTVDLDRRQIDAYGRGWTWTNTMDHTGMPLVQTGGDTPERLSHVWLMHGPLFPAPRPVTPAELRAVISACPAQDEAWPTPRTVALTLQRLRRRSA